MGIGHHCAVCIDVGWQVQVVVTHIVKIVCRTGGTDPIDHIAIGIISITGRSRKLERT